MPGMFRGAVTAKITVSAKIRSSGHLPEVNKNSSYDAFARLADSF
jgi:hypothetical protein